MNNCEHKHTAEREKIFSNGTKHMQYVSQNKEYIFYFGKYVGKTLVEVLAEDYNYVCWCLENREGLKQSKLQDAINKLAK